MKKIIFQTALMLLLLAVPASLASAHFGMIIPSDDIVSKEDNKNINLQVQFMHPFEGNYMNMEKPKAFGVLDGRKKIDLLQTLKKKKVKGFETWEAVYRIKRPGDKIFFVEPAPY